MKCYLTFTLDTPLGNNFVVIDAPTKRHARTIAFEQLDNNWAFIYNEGEFSGQPAKYGLTEITMEHAKEHAKS